MFKLRVRVQGDTELKHRRDDVKKTKLGRQGVSSPVRRVWLFVLVVCISIVLDSGPFVLLLTGGGKTSLLFSQTGK